MALISSCHLPATAFVDIANGNDIASGNQCDHSVLPVADRHRTEFRIHLGIKYLDMDTIQYKINDAIFDTIQYIMPSLMNNKLD